MQVTVKITLPIPGPALNAHAKGNSHWRKSKATKEQRSHAFLLTKPVVAETDGVPWNHSQVLYCFWFPDNRQRDAQNYKQMMKGAIDGIVDAGLIVGDHWQVLEDRGAICDIDRDNPRVELLFSRAEA